MYDKNVVIPGGARPLLKLGGRMAEQTQVSTFADEAGTRPESVVPSSRKYSAG
jgi:hypothetical protein